MSVEPIDREQALADAFEELEWLVRKLRGRGDDALDVVRNELEHLRTHREDLADALAAFDLARGDEKLRRQATLVQVVRDVAGEAAHRETTVKR